MFYSNALERELLTCTLQFVAPNCSVLELEWPSHQMSEFNTIMKQFWEGEGGGDDQNSYLFVNMLKCTQQSCQWKNLQ